MPKNKDLKRLVRARMEKTGESYTAARAHIVEQPDEPELPDDHEELAGQRDEVMLERTDATWAQWVKRLDERGCAELSHAEIAEVVGEYVDSGWWAQTVTVGYERLKGLREVGQKRDGDFEANKSKTMPVSRETIYGALVDDELRHRWLGQSLPLRHTNPPKSVRLDWPDGTRVVFYLTDKGRRKATLAVRHLKLGSADELQRCKEYWGDRLSALKELLE